MILTPYCLGSGKASEAIQKSLAWIPILNPGLTLAPTRQLRRNEALPSVKGIDTPILFIANPHGLHARAILEGARSGFQAIVTEKPAAVSPDEIRELKAVSIPVAVLHGYRCLWGLQTIRKMLDAGELGELITLEGRYWQSSAAKRALERSASGKPRDSWKNDPRLSGGFDTFLDLGTHWADTAAWLMNETRFTGTTWLSFQNAEAPHRDTHVQTVLHFSGDRRAFGSISKTAHGSGNALEWNVIGTRASASWSFSNPDEIILGRGNTKTVIVRQENHLGSRQAAFHGVGWLEGYLEIIQSIVREVSAGTVQASASTDYPRLSHNLEVLESWFKTLST